MSTEPLQGLRFSLAGPGKVGRSLAAWLKAAGAEQVAVAGRGPAGGSGGGEKEADDPAEGTRYFPLDQIETSGQDLLLVAVPDGAVSQVAEVLGRRPQARVVLHTAGSLDSAALAPLRGAGSAVGTLHPLKAFPRPLPDPAAARGVFMALEGDPPAVATGRRIALAWGSVPAEVPAAARPLYHLAATLAAGGVVTLVAAAADLARSLGLPPEVTRGYVELARGAVEAAGAAADPADALTGTVARGDLATFQRQIDTLAATAPDRLPLVLHLARETLRQLTRQAPLSPAHQALQEEIERRLA